MTTNEHFDIPIDDELLQHVTRRGRKRTINIQWAFYFQPRNVIVIVKAASLEAAMPRAVIRLQEMYVQTDKIISHAKPEDLILVKTNCPTYAQEYNGVLYTAQVGVNYKTAKKSTEFILGYRNDVPVKDREDVVAGLLGYRQHLIATMSDLYIHDVPLPDV